MTEALAADRALRIVEQPVASLGANTSIHLHRGHARLRERVVRERAP